MILVKGNRSLFNVLKSLLSAFEVAKRVLFIATSVVGPGLWGLTRSISAFLSLEGFPGGVSTCQCRRWKRCGFNLWVRKIPWRRKWQPAPALFLPEKFHGQRSLAGCKDLKRTGHSTTEHSWPLCGSQAATLPCTSKWGTGLFLGQHTPGHLWTHHSAPKYTDVSCDGYRDWESHG